MSGLETTTNATAAPASAPSQSVTPATAAPANQVGETSLTEDLSSALRAEMQSRFGGSRPPVSNDLPEGLLGGQQPAPQPLPVQPTDATGQLKELSGEEGKPAEDLDNQENQEGLDQAIAENAGDREPITAIHLERFGRDFSLTEVEAAIEGFNYYHPKALKFQEDLQRFEAEKRDFEALKTGPEMQLANILKNDPDLKQRFLQLAREQRPTAIQAHEENQKISALQAEIDQLKGAINQNQQKTQETEVQQKQQAWQRHVVETTRSVDQAVTQKLEALKAENITISDADLEMISSNAVAMVQAKRLQYTAPAVTDYITKMIDMIASKAIEARRQGVQSYQQQKQTLPPPPPSGGSATVLRPEAPKDFNEMQALLANRIEAVLNQL